MRNQKNNADDLESQDINLLPDDMRAAEEKARLSKHGNESLYQLRSPKKYRRARRVFAWLPFFGGMHWGVDAEQAEGEGADGAKSLGPIVHVEGAARKPVSMTGTSNEFGARKQPTGARGNVLPGMPKVQRPFKKGIRFPGLPRLFGGKPSAVQQPTRSHSLQQPVSRQPSFAAPPRHYSLLSDQSLADDQQTRVSRAPQMNGSVPITGPSVELPTGTPIRPIAPAAAQSGARGTRPGFVWPRWLDVFYILGRLTGGRGGKMKKMPAGAVPVHAKKEQEQRYAQPATPSSPARPMTPPAMPTVSTRPKLQAVAETMSEGQSPLQPIAPRPYTPDAMQMLKVPRARRMRTAWSLPRWLDIFYILGSFAGRTKKPKQVPPPVMKPLPVPLPAPRPYTPDAMQMLKVPRARRMRTAWSLPRWLDIFYILGSFAGRTKKPKQAPLPVMKPLPVPPPAPQPTRRPITPIVPVRDEDLKKPQEQHVQWPVTPVPAQPSSAPARPGFDGIPMQEKRPITPVPIPPLTAGMTPQPVPSPAPLMRDIPPMPSAEPPQGQPSPDKKKPGASFLHLPKKSMFSDLTRDAREANLIPAGLNLHDWPRIIQLMSVTVVATAAFIGILYGALSVWRSNIEARTAAIDKQIDRFKNDLKVYQEVEPEMTAIGERVALISGLLAKHIYWTNFFKLLEKYTLPDVYYDGLSATTNGTISLTAHASSYESVSRVLTLLASPEAKEFVTNASITGAKLVAGENVVQQVDFSVELTLNQNLFYYHEAQ